MDFGAGTGGVEGDGEIEQLVGDLDVLVEVALDDCAEDYLAETYVQVGGVGLGELLYHLLLDQVGEYPEIEG